MKTVGPVDFPGSLQHTSHPELEEKVSIKGDTVTITKFYLISYLISVAHPISSSGRANL